MMIKSDVREFADNQYNRGLSYVSLQKGDRQTNLEAAIACFQAALQIYSREEFPVEWAAAQHNLGNAYRNLQQGDRQANQVKAIECYESALQVYTHQQFP